MGIAMRDAGAVLRQIAAVSMRDEGDVLRTVQEITMRGADNVLRVIFSALSASISPLGVTGYGNSASPVDISTTSETCSTSGGVAPFTYLWARTDGGADAWSIDNPTAASTGFTATAVASTASAEFTCTVTDATGATAVAGPVPVFALNIGSPL